MNGRTTSAIAYGDPIRAAQMAGNALTPQAVVSPMLPQASS